MPKPAEWTEEEVWRLSHLYPSEKSFDEIVESFPNRTPNAIRQKASRLGLKRPSIPPHEFWSSTILMYSGGDGSTNGYLFRCSECGGWIRVDDDDDGEGGEIVCSNCNTISYIVA